MNNRNETSYSKFGRIKKTTKPTESGKKSGVFDFYDTLDETARLTADTTPQIHSPSSDEIPNLHDTTQSTTSQPSEKNISSTSPLRRSYLQSNRPTYTRYGTFKYQHRPTESISEKDHLEYSTQLQEPNAQNKPSTKSPEHSENTTPSTNLSQKNHTTNQNTPNPPTQKHPQQLENQQEKNTSMNSTLHTPPTQSSRTTDFRDNVRRQVNEQKSIGSILTLISISFAALIIVSFSLAAYGGYVMWNRLNEQSSTLADVENKFSTRLSTLQASIDRLQIDLHKTQKYSDELARQNQELTRALREQQEISRRTKAQVDTLVNQVRQEKILRDQQIRELTRDMNRNSAFRALPSTPSAPASQRIVDRTAAAPLNPVRR